MTPEAAEAHLWHAEKAVRALLASQYGTVRKTCLIADTRALVTNGDNAPVPPVEEHARRYAEVAELIKESKAQ